MKRFFDKIQKTDTCWIWQASTRSKMGYGAFKFEGKVIDAHRFSYMFHFGKIPDGSYICHRCDNPSCVNPDHLFVGTPKDNWYDGHVKGRIKLLGGITKAKVKKHPSRGAYLRGCRCSECKSLNAQRAAKCRSKLKH